jgi:glutathione synthase
MKKRSIGVILDPLSTLNIKKDTTLSMIEAAQRKGWDVYAMTLDDLFVEGAIPMAMMEKISINRKNTPYYTIHSRAKKTLNSLDFILMRKDPPYNIEYVFATSILDLVDQQKTIISNRPESLRSFNEKFLINYTSEFMPPSLFTRNREKMEEFISKHHKVVAKPMDFMGGRGVFVIDHKDLNRGVILETLTENFSKTIVLQKYLPEISKGDRRIIVIGGEAIPHVLIRKPSKTDHRGNLAAGASANFGKITAHEKNVVESLKPFFQQHGMHFVGLDFIGDYVTEINITSPTGFVQLDEQFKLSIADTYLEHLESFHMGLQNNSKSRGGSQLG